MSIHIHFRFNFKCILKFWPTVCVFRSTSVELYSNDLLSYQKFLKFTANPVHKAMKVKVNILVG
jgi:hypothetical protein